MSTILGSIGEASFVSTFTAKPFPDRPREGAARSSGDTLDLSPAAAEVLRDEREGASTARVATGAGIGALAGFKGVAAETGLATRIPTDSELHKVQGSARKTGVAALQRAAKEGASVHEMLRSVPKDATVKRFESSPNANIKEGVSFTWEEKVNGKMKKHMFEVHGPDTGPHAGPNSRSGNVARLRMSGNFYFEPATQDMHKMGKSTPEAIANSTHIPLRGNTQVPYGQLTQNVLKAERAFGRAMLPVEMGMGVYQVFSAPPEERPREAASVAGSVAGAAALAKPCAVGGAVIAGPLGAIVGGLACGAAGAFAGGEVGRALYDKMH